jgi:hypothetical protein
MYVIIYTYISSVVLKVHMSKWRPNRSVLMTDRFGRHLGATVLNVYRRDTCTRNPRILYSRNKYPCS